MTQNIGSALTNSGVGSNARVSELAHMMPIYVLQSKSDKTVSCYYSYFQRWKQFANQMGYADLPAEPIHVALYITHLLDSGSSSHTVNRTVYALKWAHDLNSFPDPTANGYVKSLQEAAKRIATPRVQRKDPVSTEMLIELCDSYSNCNDLLIIRDLTMALISFSGFLRFDELSNLKCNDVKIHDDYLSVFIHKSKTDRYRQGNEIVIAKGSSSACPMDMLMKYISIAGISLDSSQYLFKPIFRSKGIAKLIYKDKKLSYSAAKDSVLSRLKSVRPDLNLGLHSLRSGGATAAVAGDVSERCIKRHGRWKCDSSKDMYVVDQLESRLSVSKQLGL